MKISHKLCVRMVGTQFLSLWWFTAKTEGGNDKIAWVYLESGIPTGKEEKQQALPGPIGKAECIQNSSIKPIQIQFFI